VSPAAATKIRSEEGTFILLFKIKARELGGGAFCLLFLAVEKK